MKLFILLVATSLALSGATAISDPAYALIGTRIAQNQSQFFVYQDVDSPFNHGFPSGLFGSSAQAMAKLHTDPACVYNSVAAQGCATDPTALDRVRGTVFRFTFDPLTSGQSAGLNFEEPQNWGVIRNGVGYDLTGARQLVFDAISPTGGISVQFSVNGSTTGYLNIPQQWTPFTISLSSLGLSSLTGVHLLLGVASNDAHAPSGGTVLLDNIRFLPVPTSQISALGLPLANQVFGVVHGQNALPGSIPVPPDQIDANLATLYESSLALISLINRGQAQDLINAKIIADTFVNALAHDNQGDPVPASGGFTALHNGYYAGDIGLFNSQAPSGGPQGGQLGQVRLSGFTAAGQCPLTGFCLVLDGATGGNNAFGVLALLSAYKQFQTPAYLNAALTMANWIYASLLDSTGTGYGGYFVGYPDMGLTKNLQTGKSTENNADIFAAFMGLANTEAAAGNAAAASLWTTRANVGGDFVMRMFDGATGHFFAGTVPVGQPAGAGIYPNGAVRGNDVINTFDFLDTETFTTLALAPSLRYRFQIDWHLPVQWVVDHFQSSVTAAGLTYQGFDLIRAFEHLPGDGPAGISWEFTGQEVAGMKLVDALFGTAQFAAQEALYLTQIRQAQTSAPFGDGQGIVASTLQNGDTVAPYNQCLVTPYQCIAERVGLAATYWGIAAELGLNPLLLGAPPASALLDVSITDSGPFTQGLSGSYTIAISDELSAAPTSGTVTVAATVAAGATFVSMTGTGWNCVATTCTRGDVLAPGSSYPKITVNVSFAVNTTEVSTQISVSGGGSPGFTVGGPDEVGPQTGTSISQGKAATQSSTYGVSVAGLAVDGNTDGYFGDNSVATTNMDTNPWWQVDLGFSATVSAVVVWNRIDCCQSRLSDYWVFVSDTAFSPSDTPATLQGRPNTFSSHQTATPQFSASVTMNGAQGRYVRVQLSGTDYLSLAEVQVLGSNAGTPTNVALGNVATQSSTYGGAVAGKAVDGNTDGNFGFNAIATTNAESNAWWQVDLRFSATVNSVVIWNRTDCCGSRLSDYWVFISDTPFDASDTPATLQGRAGTFSSHQTFAPSPVTTVSTPGATGRYVRVQLSGSNYLSLAEVQVIGFYTSTATNVAAGKAAIQSSTYGGAAASRAVDGNTDGNFVTNFGSSTNAEVNAWWQVDLGDSATVNSVAIWNRTDCCGSRLSDYWVFVSNTPFSPADTPATLQSRAGTFSSHLTAAPAPTTSIVIPGAQGRYVRIQLSGTDYLSLAEVQVLGTLPSSLNVALGKAAAQSSTYGGATADRAVDGNTDGTLGANSVAITNADVNAWWQVDLGSSFAISSIAIWNRSDCCVNRLNDYWVFVSNTPFLLFDTPTTLQGRAGTFSSHQTTAPAPKSNIVIPGASGRYVRIQLSGTDFLTLAEVQVFSP